MSDLPSARFLATAADEPTVRIFDLNLGFQTASIGSHSKEVYAVQFSPDSKLVATGSRDKKVYLSDVTTGDLKKEKHP